MSVGHCGPALPCLVLTILMVSPVFGAVCSQQANCSNCANSPSGLSTCRWCFRDQKCHEFGAILTNPCSAGEDISRTDLCSCRDGCTIRDKANASICSWYTAKSAVVDPDSNQWFGGDFLPPPYAQNALCACDGQNHPLWQSAAASCVRANVITGHKALNATVKTELRQIVESGVYSRATKYVALLEQLHDVAYVNCCCAGKPAGYLAWLIVEQLPFPCSAILQGILLEGRCGCGF